jgi:cytochrome P450
MLEMLRGKASALHPVDPSYPPGPPAPGPMGQIPELARDQLGLYTRAARQYGDFVPLRFGIRRAIFLNHPDLIEQVLVTQNAKFIKSMALRRSRRLLGNGLLTSEGDFWRRQRRLAQPAFHRQRIAAYADTMVESTQRILADWDRLTQAAGGPAPVDVHTEMMRLTLDIVSKTLFGADVGADTEEIGQAVTIGQERFTRRISSLLFFLPETLPLPGNLPFLRAADRLDQIIYRIIAQRREQRARGEDRPDLLSMLLSAQDEDGTRMTDKQLRDECMTLFLAGHETTALALSWAWYLLSQHPEAEAALHAELDEVLQGRAPTMADLPRLPYAEAVVNEAMRLYPPAYAMGREAVEDVRLGQYTVPQGMLVLMSMYVMHRDPRYFEAPETFQPERWMKGLQKTLPRFAYFPFGGGPRLCIGNQFAMMEAVLLLVTVAQRYRLRREPGARIEPWTGITLRPKYGVPVLLERRER